MMIKDTATILITAPVKVGDPTEYTAVWAENAIKIAKDLGYNVIALKGSDTTHDKVTDAIKRYKPRMMTHFGHGCQLSLQGQSECIVSRKYSIDEMICMAESQNLEDRQKLLGFLNPLGKLSCPGICSLGDQDPCSPFCLYPTNVDLLSGSIVMAVACHSAEQLGKCAINYGVNSYIGYNDLLMFPVDSMNSQDMFGEIQLTLFKELLMGKTAQEAKETTEKLEDTYIRKYKRVKYLALPMLWNKIHRRVLGGPNTMIYE
jgi:hypothetical protein